MRDTDHRSPRDFLNLNDSIATPKVKSIFDMVSRRKRGEGEHQEGDQAKVDILRVSSNEYLYYFDRVLIRASLYNDLLQSRQSLR